MGSSEVTRAVRAMTETRVVDYSVPGGNTQRHFAYGHPIAVALLLLALLISYVNQTLWRSF